MLWCNDRVDRQVLERSSLFCCAAQGELGFCQGAEVWRDSPSCNPPMSKSSSSSKPSMSPTSSRAPFPFDGASAGADEWKDEEEVKAWREGANAGSQAFVRSSEFILRASGENATSVERAVAEVGRSAAVLSEDRAPP